MSVLPAISFAPVVTVARYVVPDNRSTFGLNVAISPLYVTTPGTSTNPFFNVKVRVLIDDMSINSLNVAVTLVLSDTLTAFDNGDVKITVGLVTSGALPVVKLHV